MSLPLVADQLVSDRPGQIRRELDSQPGAKGAMGGEASGEVALDDDRAAGGQVAADLFGDSEQGREIEAHACLNVLPLVDLATQRLIIRWHSRYQDSAPGGGQHRSDGRFPRPPESFETLEHRLVRHGRTPRREQAE